MVGTRPIRLPPRRGSASASRSSALVRTTFMRALRAFPAIASARSPARRRARRAPGAASARATRWRSTVARSPRAIGPVRASGPCSAQFAAVRRTSGASRSRASSMPIRSSSSAADSSSATSRFEAIAAAAWYAARLSSGTSNGRIPSASASERAKESGRVLGARDRRTACPPLGVAVREGLEGMQREGRGARARLPAARASSCWHRSHGRRAKRRRRRDAGAGVGDRIVGDAQQGGAGSLGSSAARRGRARSTSMPRRWAAPGKRAAHAATANDHQAARRSGGGEVIPFQFPHRRYQTVVFDGRVVEV